MTDLEALTRQLRKGSDLSIEEASAAAHGLVSPELEDAAKSAFLLALHEKGEGLTEVIAFARVFRHLAKDPELNDFAEHAIDLCGTGGDRSGSFNISTAVSFIVAAAGVPVLKHGNRSVTSKSGSADLLEALGFDLAADKKRLRQSLEKLHFCFLFAPAYHPAFKTIMPVRQALAASGKRTIFNILGPLINPARPAWQMLGVYDEKWVPALAQTLESLGVVRGLVLHGRLSEGSGMDELTCASENRVVGVGELRGIDEIWSPEAAGLTRCPRADLVGGSVEDNRLILQNMLEGRGRQGLIESILFNAGSALWLAEKGSDQEEGIALARDLLLGGGVKKWLQKAQDFYRA